MSYQSLADGLQRCRIAERAAYVPFHLIFGREVELLEEVGRDGNAAGRSDLLKGCLACVVLFQVKRSWVVIIAVVMIALRRTMAIDMIFFNVRHFGERLPILANLKGGRGLESNVEVLMEG